MNIEEELFLNLKASCDRLLNYGFIKKNNNYILEKNILDNTFKVIITINDNIKGIIIDLDTNLEYNNFRLNNNGSFSNMIREEYINILKDIKDKCFVNNYFNDNQSLKVVNYIKKKYQSNPEFLWNDYPNIAIFRKNNNKWFALISNINRNKFSNLEGITDILNIKIDESKLDDLLNKKGYYKAYHMNKKKWITVTLDNSISDKEIFSLIDNSYNLV